jgi:hypothetical protein
MLDIVTASVIICFVRVLFDMHKMLGCYYFHFKLTLIYLVVVTYPL